jgi:hypothetical protein
MATKQRRIMRKLLAAFVTARVLRMLAARGKQ